MKFPNKHNIFISLSMILALLGGPIAGQAQQQAPQQPQSQPGFFQRMFGTAAQSSQQQQQNRANAAKQAAAAGAGVAVGGLLGGLIGSQIQKKKDQQKIAEAQAQAKVQPQIQPQGVVSLPQGNIAVQAQLPQVSGTINAQGQIPGLPVTGQAHLAYTVPQYPVAVGVNATLPAGQISPMQGGVPIPQVGQQQLPTVKGVLGHTLTGAVGSALSGQNVFKGAVAGAKRGLLTPVQQQYLARYYPQYYHQYCYGQPSMGQGGTLVPPPSLQMTMPGLKLPTGQVQVGLNTPSLNLQSQYGLGQQTPPPPYSQGCMGGGGIQPTPPYMPGQYGMGLQPPAPHLQMQYGAGLQPPAPHLQMQYGAGLQPPAPYTGLQPPNPRSFECHRCLDPQFNMLNNAGCQRFCESRHKLQYDPHIQNITEGRLRVERGADRYRGELDRFTDRRRVRDRRDYLGSRRRDFRRSDPLHRLGKDSRRQFDRDNYRREEYRGPRGDFRAGYAYGY